MSKTNAVLLTGASIAIVAIAAAAVRRRAETDELERTNNLGDVGAIDDRDANMPTKTIGTVAKGAIVSLIDLASTMLPPARRHADRRPPLHSVGTDRQSLSVDQRTAAAA